MVHDKSVLQSPEPWFSARTCTREATRRSFSQASATLPIATFLDNFGVADYTSK